jgi:hypothetical protein
MSSYESHVTTSPVFDRPAKIVYPFSEVGDNATKEVHQTLYQLADRYAPPTLGAVFVGATDANFSGSPVTIGSAYCIGDFDLNESEAGLVSFTRKWSNIPAIRTEPNGSTLYQMVGLPAGIAGAVKTITACSVSGNTATFTCTAHGYIANDAIFMSVTCTVSGINVTVSSAFRVSAVTTNTFNVLGAAYFSNTLISGLVIKTLPYRATKQVKTTSFMRYDYALPGVTSGISAFTDFTPEKPFDPILTTTGQSISDYEDLRNTLGPLTTPTDTEYIDMIKAGDFIVAESNISNYKGSILERATLMVRAM